MVSTEPGPVINPILRARVMAALDRAGRPLTRGELPMHLTGGPQPSSAKLQAVLDALVTNGLAEVGAQRDERRDWEYVTYRATSTWAGGGGPTP